MSSPSIPLTARAAVLKQVGGQYEIINDHPVPQPSQLAPGECLIRLQYSGVCHSDVHIKKGDWRSPPVPIIGGHEGIGTVVAIGNGTVDPEVQVGDRVGIKWIARTCFRCEMCRTDNETASERLMDTLKTVVSLNMRYGSIASDDIPLIGIKLSYTNYVTPIPPNLDGILAAPMLCAGLTVYKALKNSQARVNQWVAIPGAGGGLGHLAVQFAVAMGLRVIAIDSGDSKRELCMKLGAEKWVDFRQSKDVIEDVQVAADGLGPHVAIITAGAPEPVNQAVQYLRRAGTLVCAGMPERTALFNAPIVLIVGKSLRIIGTALGNRQDVIEALDLAAQGKVKCQVQIRELDELNTVLNELDAGKVAGRVVLRL